jgi:hypothetical protein
MRVSTTIAAVIFVVSLHQSALAQQIDCEQQLILATDEFNAGRFFSVPGMLRACLDAGFSREQRQRANLLLAQTYLLLDEPEAAEKSYMDVLWANPEFETDTLRDPIDLIYLGRKFTADPVFSLFMRAGGNVSPVRVIHSINPTGEADVVDNYSLRFGFHLGGGADWHVSEKLSITAEVNYTFTQYYKTQVKFNGDLEEFTDRQRWMTLPLSIRYSHGRGRYRPFVFAGFSLQWLLTDRAQLRSSKVDFIEDQAVTIPAESPTLVLTRYRNTSNQSVFIGGGVKQKVGLDFVFAEMRYGIGLRNVVVPTSTFDSTGPAPEWGHVDDYFRLDNLSVSIGYIRPLYKPRKLKHARTWSVLRGINRQSK